MPLELILFPGERDMIYVIEKKYLQLIRECEEEEKPFGLLSIREGKAPVVNRSLYGTIVKIYKIYKRHLDGGVQVGIEGQEAFELIDVYPSKKKNPKPYLTAKVRELKEKKANPKKIKKLKALLFEEFKEIRVLFQTELGEKVGEAINLSQESFYYEVVNFIGMGFGSQRDMLLKQTDEKKAFCISSDIASVFYLISKQLLRVD